jgi:hypothetical protein
VLFYKSQVERKRWLLFLVGKSHVRVYCRFGSCFAGSAVRMPGVSSMENIVELYLKTNPAIGYYAGVATTARIHV